MQHKRWQGNSQLRSTSNRTIKFSHLKIQEKYYFLYVFDARVGSSLTVSDAMPPNWLHSIMQRVVLEIRTEPDTRVLLSWTIALHLRISYSRTLDTSDVVERVTIHVLIGTTIIGRYIKSFQPAEGNNVFSHSTTVTLLIVYQRLHCNSEGIWVESWRVRHLWSGFIDIAHWKRSNVYCGLPTKMFLNPYNIHQRCSQHKRLFWRR